MYRVPLFRGRGTGVLLAIVILETSICAYGGHYLWDQLRTARRQLAETAQQLNQAQAWAREFNSRLDGIEQTIRSQK